MSQPPTSPDPRAHRARAVAELRKYLPTDRVTQLIDFWSVSDGQLEEILNLSDGLLGVVVISLRHDEVYRGEGPPHPFVGVEHHVLARAAEIIVPMIRASDLPLRLEPLKLGVLLLGAGSLEARAQSGRLRPPIAEARFEEQDYLVRWRGQVAMASTQVMPPIPSARGVVVGLIEGAK